MIDELEALARAATPGEWLALKTRKYDNGWQIEGPDGYRICMVPNSSQKPMNAANAAHIAACSPDAILKLAAVVKAAQIVHEQWRQGSALAGPFSDLRAALEGLTP